MFRRATLATLVELLSENASTSQISLLLKKYEIPEKGNNKLDKAMCILNYLEKNPNEVGPMGSLLNYEIVSEIIEQYIDFNRAEEQYKLYKYEANYEKAVKKSYRKHLELKRLLELDGFYIKNGELIRATREVNLTKEKENLFTSYLKEDKFKTAFGHYNQALNNYTSGNWAACNASLRSCVEDIFIQLAKILTGEDFETYNTYKAIEALNNSKQKILYENLNEFLKDGKGYYQAFWKRLHPEGPHAGLSDKEDSLFRIQLVEISMLQLFKRADKFIF